MTETTFLVPDSQRDPGSISFEGRWPATTAEAETKLQEGSDSYERYRDTTEMERMLLTQSPELAEFKSVVAVWFGPNGVQAIECHSSSVPLNFQMVRLKILYLGIWPDRFYMVKKAEVTETASAES